MTRPTTWTAWRTSELRTVERLYPVGGSNACVAALPGRSKAAVREFARKRGLRAPDRSAFRHLDANRSDAR